ncbi:MAG: acetoacetate--CoA ligase [Betaproteobacteria bacterium]|nr:MAG: acetoacetate--CoA ligase [Betaproteobacteria bacterium]
MNAPLWQPSPERIARANLTSFAARIAARHGVELPDYTALYAWSLANSETFWQELWEFAGIVGQRGTRTLVDGHRMPGARWFPDARLSFTENLFGRRERDDTGDAMVFWGEDKLKRHVSHAELYDAVSRTAEALRAAGVGAGDRVSGFLPNMPETVIAMLATAALGAIWSSASPDFGVQGVLDRFGQIEPKVLFTVDGYWYNGKPQPILDKVAAVAAGLPTLRCVVVASYLEAKADFGRVPHAIGWQDFLSAHKPETMAFERFPFDHPLYILYSSGTTGVPKCIVHGVGGTLLQHVKEHRLHGDVNPGDRLFYFTTCGWMMWNWLASGLASGATLLLYDGSPFVGDGRILWDFAEQERMTHFGTSAKYIDALKKAGVVPRTHYGLDSLQAMFSTGSPLAPEGFDYVYQCVKDDLCLSSISGGTDIIACFALGCPTRPVWRGELQCRALGMAVAAFDEDGDAIAAGSKLRGELVCTQPFPSMPIGFWNDPGGTRYRAAYFERFPGVWCHGDYIEITEHDGMIIYGRSDATLNPGGVRIGTAEIYRQVEQLDEVLESIVIGQDWPPGELGDVRVVLFVRLREGLTLDNELIAKVKRQIRSNTTPRHVPAKVVQVSDIPRTKSGKIVELAVRNVVHGQAVKNVEALANPEALEQFRDRFELRS